MPADRFGRLERERVAVGSGGILAAAALGEQLGARDVQLGQRVSWELAARVWRIASPAAGPSAYATATARFASMTGDESNRSSSLYSAAICRQSVSAAVAASAWQAAMAACS